MRRKARIDSNQPKIVKILREFGVSVSVTSALGKGFPDIVCGTAKNGKRNYFFEIKDPSKPPSARELTPDEKKFQAEWKGQYDVIETADQALTIMGYLIIKTKKPSR